MVFEPIGLQGVDHKVNGHVTSVKNQVSGESVLKLSGRAPKGERLVGCGSIVATLSVRRIAGRKRSVDVGVGVGRR